MGFLLFLRGSDVIGKNFFASKGGSNGCVPMRKLKLRVVFDGSMLEQLFWKDSEEGMYSAES